MITPDNHPGTSWQTKPTDRFILKWIKINLSARLTPLLVRFRWLKPWMITVLANLIGTSAGFALALGWGFIAGIMAAAAQVLDGVDGQFARLTSRQTTAGAFLDSVLDRYTDGFLIFGLIIYNGRMGLPVWLLIPVGGLALIGSSLISYSSARAENLGIDLGRPTLASKGTRTTVVAISGILSPIFPFIQLVALCYLALHTNLVVLYRIAVAFNAAAYHKSALG
ncbi:MAG: CDP-alcohol phosphatidyltransferase family protein [Desulfomonilaceae bacterium]